MHTFEGHPHEEEVEHAVDHESHLYYHLLDHYVRDIRPAANDTDPVRVAVKLSILSLDGPVRREPGVNCKVRCDI